MDNVPVRVNDPAATARNTGSRSHLPAYSDKKKNKLKLIAAATGAAVLLAIFVLGGLFVYGASTSAAIDGNKYQAVFFTNGQVYFGKLKTINGSYMKLTDIFYLQAQATTTAEDGSKNPQETTTQKASDVELIKLGNEVHGPDDEMIINKDQILFFENLKKDGKVTDSIAKYLSQKK